MTSSISTYEFGTAIALQGQNLPHNIFHLDPLFETARFALDSKSKAESSHPRQDS
jgi:hypothetical protein